MELDVNSWTDVLAMPGLSVVLFALGLSAIVSLKSWKTIARLSLVMLAALVISMLLNMGDLASITEKQSALYCIILVLFSGVLSMAWKEKAVDKVWMVLTGLFGLFYGLNAKLISNPKYLVTSIWKDAPLLILKVVVGFFVAFIVIQVFIWLVQTAFTVQDRDRKLVLSGGVIGGASIMLYQLLASY